MVELSRPRKRKRAISKRTSAARLYSEDSLDVDRMARDQKKDRSYILRELVAGQLRHQRLKSAGLDEAMIAVREEQKLVVEAALGPLIDLLNQQKKYVETVSLRTLEECAEIRERLILLEDNSRRLASNYDRILRGVVMIRVLIWHYIFTFYHKIIVEAGRKVSNAELEESYTKRVARIRRKIAEADRDLDDQLIDDTVAAIGTENLPKNRA